MKLIYAIVAFLFLEASIYANFVCGGRVTDELMGEVSHDRVALFFKNKTMTYVGPFFSLRDSIWSAKYNVSVSSASGKDSLTYSLSDVSTGHGADNYTLNLVFNSDSFNLWIRSKEIKTIYSDFYIKAIETGPAHVITGRLLCKKVQR